MNLAGGYRLLWCTACPPVGTGIRKREGDMGRNVYRGTRRSDYAQPGGNSALRAATRDNPRNRPCPTCGRKNVLTPADVRRGYQCNRCADAAEGAY
jgi:hypothetical protein